MVDHWWRNPGKGPLSRDQRRTIRASFGLAALAFVALALVGHGSFGHVAIAVLAGLIGLGLLAVLLSLRLLSLRVPWSRRVEMRWALTVCLSLFVVSMGGCTSIVGGCWWDGSRTERTQTFCETLIPSIEVLRKEDGRYPTSINPLLVQSGYPSLLLRSVHYEVNEDGFDLYVGDFLDCDGGRWYSSDTGEWRDGWD